MTSDAAEEQGPFVWSDVSQIQSMETCCMSKSNDDEDEEDVCYIGKPKCSCVATCKCKSKATQKPLDPVMFDHSHCHERIKTLEEELKSAQDENDRLKKENTSLANNFKRVAASAGDMIEMQKVITKANATIEGLKQRVFDLEEQVQHNGISNEPKNKREKVMEELKQKDAELRDAMHKLRSAEMNVEVHANNLTSMETIMSKQLAQLSTELHECKEEIAIKVSQVIQYQKQVEAYKLKVGELHEEKECEVKKTERESL